MVQFLQNCVQWKSLVITALKVLDSSERASVCLGAHQHPCMCVCVGGGAISASAEKLHTFQVRHSAI
jgi:hypothetical protein